MRASEGGAELVVAAELAEAARALGLGTPGGLERLLAGAAGPSGRGRIAIVALPGRPERLCLRPLRRGGLLAPVLPAAPTGRTRPLAELHTTARLRAAGAPVPRPALVACDEGAGAALGTIYEEGTVDALHFVASAPPRGELVQAAAALGRAVRRFHDAGGRHADLHVKNLLLRRTGSGFEALVVDLDRARAGAPPGPQRRMAELMRLLRSLHKRGLATAVGPRGVAACFGAYVGRDRALRRALLRWRGWERLRLGWHALHYRRR